MLIADGYRNVKSHNKTYSCKSEVADTILGKAVFFIVVGATYRTFEVLHVVDEFILVK